ncbi:MAG: CinA family protein [Myxococcota bacterium]
MTSALIRVAKILKERKITISTAESCTGGLLAKMLTDIPGASRYFLLGLVTYSDEAKRKLLNVKASTLKRYGAVSEETALEMVKGLKKLIGTDICVSITGIAGPDGGSRKKPVGLVFFGLSVYDKYFNYKKIFRGNRAAIREKGVNFILNEILKRIGG